MNRLRNKTAGFTIIEVLIVLAIAGLIMVIVFFAVPTLQRNSRNTQMRNDASSILGYISEFSSNHNGKLPYDVCVDSSSGTVKFKQDTAGSCDQEAGKIRADVELTTDTSAAPSMPGADEVQKFVIALNQKCNSDSTAFGGKLNRAVSVGFNAEKAGGTDPQCIQS